jgi:integrase
MSVYRRRDTGQWLIDVTVDGRRWRETLPAGLGRAEAKALEAHRRTELPLERRGLQRRRLSVRDALSRYWEEGRFRKSAQPAIAPQLDAVDDAVRDGEMLDELDTARVRELIARWRRRVSDSTVNRRLARLRRVWTVARTIWQVRTADVSCAGLRLQEPEPVEHWLTTAERRRLVEAAPPHLHLAIELALLTGLRRGVVLALRWERVGLEHGLIYAHGKGEAPGGKRNTVPITSALRALLAGAGPRPTGPVVAWRGRAVRSIKSAWATTRRKARLPRVRFHDLRHSLAQDLLEAGADLALVQAALHHSGPKTTRRYAHTRVQQIAEALERAQSRH